MIKNGPKIKKVMKKFGNTTFVSYEYKGIKYNTKGEILKDIKKGKFGRRLYLKYR